MRSMTVLEIALEIDRSQGSVSDRMRLDPPPSTTGVIQANLASRRAWRQIWRSRRSAECERS